MPVRKAAIQTPDLLAQLSSLPDVIPLIPEQVTLLTGISSDSLKERRRPPPKPPIALPALDGKPGAFTWYSLGEVRRFWKIRDGDREAALSPPVFGFVSFAQFMDDGAATDTWPFALVDERRKPVDLVARMLTGVPLTESDGCELLTLAEYLELRRTWALIEPGVEYEREARDSMPPGIPASEGPRL